MTENNKMKMKHEIERLTATSTCKVIDDKKYMHNMYITVSYDDDECEYYNYNRSADDCLDMIDSKLEECGYYSDYAIKNSVRIDYAVKNSVHNTVNSHHCDDDEIIRYDSYYKNKYDNNRLVCVTYYAINHTDDEIELYEYLDDEYNEIVSDFNINCTTIK